MSHQVFKAYLTLAAGEFLPDQRAELLDSEGDLALASWPWWDHPRDLERILEARGITREKFLGLGMLPKPTFVENLIYCGELRARYGDLSRVKGFDMKGNFILPKPDGIIGPVTSGPLILSIEFYPYSRIFKKKLQRAV